MTDSMAHGILRCLAWILWTPVLLVGLLMVFMMVFMVFTVAQFFVPADMAATLCLGWIPYPLIVGEHVRIDGPSTATGVLALATFTAGLHVMLRRITASRTEGRWKWRWTRALVSMMTLLVLASLATFGVAHAAFRLIAGKESWTKPLCVIDHGQTSALQSLSWSNLRNMGLVFDGYHQSHKALPPGGTFDEIGRPLHGWMTASLPYLEQNQLYNAINLEVPWDDPANAAPFREVLIFFRNVKVPVQYNRDVRGYALSHYAGNAHVLGGDRAWKLEEIRDGTSQTILAGEAAGNFKPWGDPVNWRDPALGINKSPDGFGGPFKGGANVVFADGSVRFIKETIDPRVLKALGTPDGGEVVGADEY